MKDPFKQSKLRVVVVGGGIGGLAFANALQHAGIDYVLIEKGETLDPQIGASIGILPNGARILDQLGCLSDLEDVTIAMESTATHTGNGTLIGQISDVLVLIQQRTGYPVFFLDRQLLLGTLACHIQDLDRIRLSTTVRSIDQYHDKAVVHCTDGTALEADIVIGADGVHSIVRREMWRHADLAGDSQKFAQDKQVMSAEYKCLFGISNPIKCMRPGESDRTYSKDVSTLSYVGVKGRIFWFAFIKMNQVFYPPNIPKFTTEDIESTLNQIGSLAIREAGTVTVGDLYQERIVCNLVAIEEAAFNYWSHGRLACLGDSIHKMTPNAGAGATSAMESAVVLANQLAEATSGSSKPLLSEINNAFQRYHDERVIRLDRAMSMTNRLTRLQALQSMTDYVLTHFVGPHADDATAEIFSDFIIGAPYLKFLPIPERSLQGTMPFNPKQGWGYKESRFARMGRALPLLAIALFSLLPISHLPYWMPHSTSLQSSWHHLSTTFTTEMNSSHQELALAVAADATYGLWLFESTRLSNNMTLIQIPIMFCLAWQTLGRGFTIPFYFFLLYILTPVEKFRSLDNRLTDVSYTCSVGAIIFLCGTVPKYLQYYTEFLGDNDRGIFSQLIIPQQPVLLLVVVTTRYLITRVVRRSTIRHDRLWALRRDVKPIRWNTLTLVFLTSLSWITHLYRISGLLQSAIFRLDSVSEMWWASLGKDGTISTLTTIVWLALVFRDLRDAGMVKVSCFKLYVAGVICTIFLGPGSALVVGWQTREEILISRRHRDAVVERGFKREVE